MSKMKSYKSKGFVLGKLWMGGSGAYPAEPLTAKTKGGLLNKAKRMLKSGALDSGMGFDGLIGAMLYIEEIETINVNGKEYSRSEFSDELIGNLNEEQKEFLLTIPEHY